MYGKKPIIILVGLVLMSTTLVGAYISVSGIHLPDVPVTLNAVMDGTYSYFNSTLSGVPAGNDVTNSEYPGWCAQYGEAIPWGNDFTVTLYDCYDPTLPAAFQGNWTSINWILNNMRGFPMYNIQEAIWYFLNQRDYSWLSGTGKYIVDHTLPPVGYAPQTGEIIAIVAVPENSNIQCTFIELVIPEHNSYQGLTPGFWKNHKDAWVTYSTGQNLGSVFSSSAGSDSLSAALRFKGGPGLDGAKRILLRAAVAALLNAEHPDINYPLSTSDVISQVNNALNSNDRDIMLNLASELDTYNNLEGVEI